MRRSLLVCAWVGLVGCGAADDRRKPPSEGPGSPPSVTEPDETAPPDDTTDPTEDAPPQLCDAGTDAWVARVMPLVWGRRPHGAAEVRQWALAADAWGRDVVTRALTGHPDHRSWYRTWFTDALFVARTGDKRDPQCFETPLLAVHDGALAQHIRSQEPAAGPFGEAFNMADVIADALVADDVSVIYQAHLFARMNRPVLGANVSEEQLEFNRRVSFGEVFYGTYLNRDLGCMVCHNSEYSVTDSPDPALDRTWTLGAHLEKALLGDSAGIGTDEAYALFRYDALVARQPMLRAVSPWGMDPVCGTYKPSSSFGEDMLGQEAAVFIGDHGQEGSVWQLERFLVEGADALAGQGLQVAPDQSVDGPPAFAYLLAANIADQVWAYGTGERLTVAHHLSRNEGQATRLKHLTDTLVTSGFSLRDLLVAVATDPAFNAGLPQECGEDVDPYGMDAIFNPWSIADDDEGRRGNGPGDLVHRLTARALLGSFHAAMAWDAPPEWSLNDDSEELQAALGAFLRESQPDFNGSDFQGVLSFEGTYGTCSRETATRQLDFIDRVRNQAGAANATVADAAHAVKDRFTAQGLDIDEQPLVEALLGVPLSTPIDEVPLGFWKQLRLFCGAVSLSPDAFLSLDPLPIGPVPALAQGVDDSCASLVALLAAEKIELTCTDGMPDVPTLPTP